MLAYVGRTYLCNVLTDTSDHLFESGAYAHVDYLVGCTENDIGVTPEMKANHQKGQLYGSLKRLCLLQDQLGRLRICIISHILRWEMTWDHSIHLNYGICSEHWAEAGVPNRRKTMHYPVRCLISGPIL